jgi:hypothetical protein
MGRGLSRLQRHILAEAGRRSRVFYAEVLAGYFGWAPKYPLKRDSDGTLAGPGDQKFSRRGVGEKVYRKTLATLSRSCLRLQQRGLVTCLRGEYGRWAAVEITDKGREWLSANLVPTTAPS